MAPPENQAFIEKIIATNLDRASAKAARGGGNVGGTQPSPIQLDCLRAARRRGKDEPDWGAYWTRLAEHQEAAGQHLAASMARREAENETVPWHHTAHAAASGWP